MVAGCSRPIRIILHRTRLDTFAPEPQPAPKQLIGKLQAINEPRQEAIRALRRDMDGVRTV